MLAHADMTDSSGILQAVDAVRAARRRLLTKYGARGLQAEAISAIAEIMAAVFTARGVSTEDPRGNGAGCVSVCDDGCFSERAFGFTD